MTRPQPIPEQTQDVVTALRVQVDALAAELERLRDEVEQRAAMEIRLFDERDRLESRLALAERAIQDHDQLKGAVIEVLNHDCQSCREHWCDAREAAVMRLAIALDHVSARFTATIDAEERTSR